MDEDVGAAGEHRLPRLVLGIGQHALRRALEQIGVELDRLDRLRPVQRRHDIAGRIAEHIAAKALHVGRQIPVMEHPRDDAGHAIGAVDLGANLLQFGKGLGDLQSLLLHQVHARQPHHHGATFPRVAIGRALGIAVRHLRAVDKILRIPFGRREVRIGSELVEIGEQPGPDPSPSENEGHVAEIIGRAARRQFEIGLLVVDRERRELQVDLHACLLFELGNVVLQQREEVVLERGACSVTPEKGLDCAIAGSGKAAAPSAAAPPLSKVLRLNGPVEAVDLLLATAPSPDVFWLI